MTKQDKNVKVAKLKNGGTLIYQQSKGKMSYFSVAFVCAPEEKDKIGMRHKLEHNIFNGTLEYSKETIARALSDLGVEYNAFTTSQLITLEGDCPTKSLNNFMDIGSSMCSCKYINKDMLDLEDEAIIEEMHIYEGEGYADIDVILEHLNFMIKPSTKETNLLGSEKSVRGVSANDLIKYKQENFVGENMVVSVVSDLPFEEVLKMTENTYGKKIESHPEHRNKYEKIKLNNDTNYFSKSKDNQSHTVEISISIPCKRDLAMVKLLNRVLNGFDGELLKNLRTKRGLVYSAQFSARELSANKLLLNFYATTSITKVNESIDILTRIISKLGTYGLTREEFDRYMNNIKTRDDCKTRVLIDPDKITTKYLNGYNVTKTKINMDNLTFEQVNDQLKKTFGNAHVLVSLSGDLPEDCYNVQQIFKKLGAKTPKVAIQNGIYYDFLTGKKLSEEQTLKMLFGTMKENEAKMCYIVDYTQPIDEGKEIDRADTQSTDLRKVLENLPATSREYLLSELLLTLNYGAYSLETMQKVYIDNSLVKKMVEGIDDITRMTILKELLDMYNYGLYDLSTNMPISLQPNEDVENEQTPDENKEDTSDKEDTNDEEDNKKEDKHNGGNNDGENSLITKSNKDDPNY